jgi:hypothetical protein
VTREHIFPRWLHAYLPQQGGNATINVRMEYADRVDVLDDVTLNGPLRHWQIRCVCGNYRGSCNGDWMSKIEKSTQRVMEPMLLGERLRLSETDQKTIATWAVLKAIVVHHRFVHHMQRKEMRTRKEPPKGWSVWIARHEAGPLGKWVSRPMTIDPADSRRRDGRKGAVANNHTSTQFLSEILIHVVKLPYLHFAEQWKWVNAQGHPISGALLRIWPPTGQSLVWPQKALTEVDALTVVESVYSAFINVGIEKGLIRRNHAPD